MTADRSLISRLHEFRDDLVGVMAFLDECEGRGIEIPDLDQIPDEYRTRNVVEWMLFAKSLNARFRYNTDEIEWFWRECEINLPLLKNYLQIKVDECKPPPDKPSAWIPLPDGTQTIRFE